SRARSLAAARPGNSGPSPATWCVSTPSGIASRYSGIPRTSAGTPQASASHSTIPSVSSLVRKQNASAPQYASRSCSACTYPGNSAFAGAPARARSTSAVSSLGSVRPYQTKVTSGICRATSTQSRMPLRRSCIPTLITTAASWGRPSASRRRSRAEGSGRKKRVATPLESTRIGARSPYFGAEISCAEYSLGVTTVSPRRYRSAIQRRNSGARRFEPGKESRKSSSVECAHTSAGRLRSRAHRASSSVSGNGVFRWTTSKGPSGSVTTSWPRALTAFSWWRIAAPMPDSRARAASPRGSSTRSGGPSAPACCAAGRAGAERRRARDFMSMTGFRSPGQEAEHEGADAQSVGDQGPRLAQQDDRDVGAPPHPGRAGDVAQQVVRGDRQRDSEGEGACETAAAGPAQEPLDRARAEQPFDEAQAHVAGDGEVQQGPGADGDVVEDRPLDRAEQHRAGDHQQPGGH